MLGRKSAGLALMRVVVRTDARFVLFEICGKISITDARLTIFLPPIVKRASTRLASVDF